MRPGAFSATVLLLVLVFLIGPFLIIVAASLSGGETLAFPPRGLSLRWFGKVFEVESFRASFLLSLGLAIGATLAALALGIPAAYALSRYKVPFGEALRTIVSSPIIVPGIVVGLALLRYFVVPFHLGIVVALFLAHTALVLPYALRVVSASLNNLRPDLEEAAILLGASRRQAFFRVVLPNVQDGVWAALILGFVTSFNQVPVSLFLSGPGIETLPVDMLSYLEITYDPSVAALSTLLALLSLAIVFLAERFLGLTRYVEPAYLALEQLTLGYGEVVAVAGLDLSIGRGELVALLGPSGCGKTTTMRAIAGLLQPVSGRIRLDGADITRLAANKREVGLVFQSYALFPHLTVFENVAFGLRLKGFRGSDLASRVESGLQSVGLVDFAARKTTQLSGGQQQRVALARSMVVEPKVLLLDEPLSNLDARLRLEMRAELQRVQKETGVTMIFVTHDQGEALALADRIVVMWKGAVEQIGTPEQIYDRPVSAFVADFVGFENCFAVERGGLKTGDGVVALAGPIPEGAAGLAWRPEAVALGAGPFQGVVRGASFAGATRQYLLDAPPLGPIKAEAPAALPPHGIGTMLKFDLPVGRAARLARF